tara:strand:+ start:2624 stop:3466 length:843 start_codon:yes stop_codon:yes gene_type:complete
MQKINYLSDNYFYLAGPVNQATGGAVGTDPVSCVLRLYNERRQMRTAAFETRLVAAASSAENSVSLPKMDPLVLAVGDSLRFINSKSFSKTLAITGITPGTFSDVYALSAVMADDFEAGSRVELSFQASGGSYFMFELEPKFEVGETITPQHGATHQTGLVEQKREIEFTQSDGTSPATKSIDHPNYWAVKSGTPTSSACYPNTVIRVQLGGDVAMASFGSFPAANAVGGDPTWGFRGLVSSTHPDIVLGQDVRAEVDYDGGVNSKLTISSRAKVLEDFS